MIGGSFGDIVVGETPPSAVGGTGGNIQVLPQQPVGQRVGVPDAYKQIPLPAGFTYGVGPSSYSSWAALFSGFGPRSQKTEAFSIARLHPPVKFIADYLPALMDLVTLYPQDLANQKSALERLKEQLARVTGGLDVSAINGYIQNLNGRVTTLSSSVDALGTRAGRLEAPWGQGGVLWQLFVENVGSTRWDYLKNLIDQFRTGALAVGGGGSPIDLNLISALNDAKDRLVGFLGDVNYGAPITYTEGNATATVASSPLGHALVLFGPGGFSIPRNWQGLLDTKREWVGNKGDLLGIRDRLGEILGQMPAGTKLSDLFSFWHAGGVAGFDWKDWKKKLTDLTSPFGKFHTAIRDRLQRLKDLITYFREHLLARLTSTADAIDTEASPDAEAFNLGMGGVKRELDDAIAAVKGTWAASRRAVPIVGGLDLSATLEAFGPTLSTNMDDLGKRLQTVFGVGPYDFTRDLATPYGTVTAHRGIRGILDVIWGMLVALFAEIRALPGDIAAAFGKPVGW